MNITNPENVTSSALAAIKCLSFLLAHCICSLSVNDRLKLDKYHMMRICAVPLGNPFHQLSIIFSKIMQMLHSDWLSHRRSPG